MLQNMIETKMVGHVKKISLLMGFSKACFRQNHETNKKLTIKAKTDEKI